LNEIIVHYNYILEHINLEEINYVMLIISYNKYIALCVFIVTFSLCKFVIIIKKITRIEQKVWPKMLYTKESFILNIYTKLFSHASLWIRLFKYSSRNNCKMIEEERHWWIQFLGVLLPGVTVISFPWLMSRWGGLCKAKQSKVNIHHALAMILW
jgi:hypothetical protein